MRWLVVSALLGCARVASTPLPRTELASGRAPAIAADRGGKTIAVAWVLDDAIGVARSFDGGANFGVQWIASRTLHAAIGPPAITVDAEGSVDVAWTAETTDHLTQVVWAHASSRGAFDVRAIGPPGKNVPAPAIARIGAGLVLVTSEDTKIVARVVGPNGAVLGERVASNWRGWGPVLCATPDASRVHLVYRVDEVHLVEKSSTDGVTWTDARHLLDDLRDRVSTGVPACAANAHEIAVVEGVSPRENFPGGRSREIVFAFARDDAPFSASHFFAPPDAAATYGRDIALTADATSGFDLAFDAMQTTDRDAAFFFAHVDEEGVGRAIELHLATDDVNDSGNESVASTTRGRIVALGTFAWGEPTIVLVRPDDGSSVTP